MKNYESKSSFFVFDKDLNYANSLFGGKLMAECDCEAAKVGWKLAKDVGADNAVTRYFTMNFVAPASKGDLIEMNAYITKSGRTSLTVDVDCFKLQDSRTKVFMGKATTVFVLLKDGKPYQWNN